MSTARWVRRELAAEHAARPAETTEAYQDRVYRTFKAEMEDIAEAVRLGIITDAQASPLRARALTRDCGGRYLGRAAS